MTHPTWQEHERARAGLPKSPSPGVASDELRAKANTVLDAELAVAEAWKRDKIGLTESLAINNALLVQARATAAFEEVATPAAILALIDRAERAERAITEWVVAAAEFEAWRTSAADRDRGDAWGASLDRFTHATRALQSFAPTEDSHA